MVRAMLAAGALTPSERTKLRTLMEARGRRSVDLARDLQVPEGYISKLLSGKDGASLQRWREICRLLGIGLAELFDDKPVVVKREALEPAQILSEMERLVRALRGAMPPAQAEAWEAWTAGIAAEDRQVSAPDERSPSDGRAPGPARTRPAHTKGRPRNKRDQ